MSNPYNEKDRLKAVDLAGPLFSPSLTSDTEVRVKCQIKRVTSQGEITLAFTGYHGCHRLSSNSISGMMMLM
ncbi:hypothetical protein ES703_42846 [subsurface metagenome]